MCWACAVVPAMPCCAACAVSVWHGSFVRIKAHQEARGAHLSTFTIIQRAPCTAGWQHGLLQLVERSGTEPGSCASREQQLSRAGLATSDVPDGCDVSVGQLADTCRQRYPGPQTNRRAVQMSHNQCAAQLLKLVSACVGSSNLQPI